MGKNKELNMNQFRKNYDYSKRVKLDFTKPSLTVQDAKDECDVNNILQRFNRTGVLTHVSQAVAKYLDTTNMPNYQEALNQAYDAQSTFMQLPAALRERFANDPLQFLNFVSNPANASELIKLGLAVPTPPEPTEAATQPPKASKPEGKADKAE